MPADKPFLAGAGESRWITWQVLLGCDGGYLSMFDFVFLARRAAPCSRMPTFMFTRARAGTATRAR